MYIKDAHKYIHDQLITLEMLESTLQDLPPTRANLELYTLKKGLQRDLSPIISNPVARAYFSTEMGTLYLSKGQSESVRKALVDASCPFLEDTKLEEAFTTTYLYLSAEI